jgi:hypothetical protein
VETISANHPKSSDRKIKAGLDEIIIIPPICHDAAHSAEVVGILISTEYSKGKSLEQPLVQANG